MAAEERHGAASLPKPAPSAGSKTEVYRYSASSYTTKSNEEELFELVQLSGVPMDKELFKVILELLKLNIAPTAILQILKTIKSKVTPEDTSAHSSRQQSPVPSVHTAQSSNTVLHHVTPAQSSSAAIHSTTPDQGVSARDQRSSQHHQTEHKSSRSKSSRSAEKTGEKTSKPSSSSRHRSSSLKHKPSGSSSKTQSSTKT